jgi:hypothetical protein
MPGVRLWEESNLAIPDLTDDGMLPVGLHECTLDELREVFGRFNKSDRRPRLFRDLERYCDEVAAAGVGQYLVVNGSFVTAKPDPNDIDVLLVLPVDLDLTRPVPPYEYNARSKKYVRREYGLDLFPVFENDPTYERMLGVFRQVKYQPGVEKGVLKVAV